MPPARIRSPREPTLTTKGAGGYGVTFGGLGFGGFGFFPGATGVAVTPYAALQIPTAWACITRKAQDIGKLPRLVKQLLPNGGYRVDRAHPLNVLLRDPNPWQTPSQCWAFMTACLDLRGNSYAAVLRGRAGEPRQFIPVSPDRCVPMLNTNGELYYQVSHPYIGDGLKFHRDNMVHLRGGVSFDSYVGVSAIQASQDAFGIGIASQQHGATLFRQGAQISGLIKHPKVLNDVAKTNLSRQFSEKYAGVQNAHRVPVLDEGMEYVKIGMTSEDAQLLGTRQFTVPEICRMFGVPPHKVHDLSDAHYSVYEQAELAYRNDTLLPIGVQLREELGRVLLYSDERGEFEIDMDYDELAKADRKTRYQTDEIGIRSGRLTQNEARIGDGREPNVPKGDEYLTMMNLQSASSDAALAEDMKPEPSSGGRES